MIAHALATSNCMPCHRKAARRFKLGMPCPRVQLLSTFCGVLQEEALTVSSAVHTIKLRKITATDHTFVEWVTDYSADGNFTPPRLPLCARSGPFLSLTDVRGVSNLLQRAYWQPPVRWSWTPSSKSSMVRSFPSPVRSSGVVCPC